MSPRWRRAGSAPCGARATTATRPTAGGWRSGKDGRLIVSRVHDDTAEPFAYMAHTAPSGLAAIDDRTLAVCGVVSQRLDRFAVADDGTAHVSGPPIAQGCTIGVIGLSDGRRAYATETRISVVRPQTPPAGSHRMEPHRCGKPAIPPRACPDCAIAGAA